MPFPPPFPQPFWFPPPGNTVDKAAAMADPIAVASRSLLFFPHTIASGKKVGKQISTQQRSLGRMQEQRPTATPLLGAEMIWANMA